MPRTHDENRNLICILCCNKIKQNKAIQNNESISQSIRKYIYEDFLAQDPHYPSSICQGCRQKLYRLSKGQKVNLPSFYDFKAETIRPNNTRAQNICECFICEKSRDRRCIKSKAKALTCSIKICDVCKGKVAKGISHICKKSEISENIVALTASCSVKSQGQIATKLLTSLGDNEKEIKVATKGRYKTIVMNPKKENKKVIMSDDFKILKEKLNLSNNQTYKVAQWIRGSLGMLIL